MNALYYLILIKVLISVSGMEQYMVAILVIFKIHNKTQTIPLTVLVEEEVKKLRTTMK